jgi:hypothetical protein
LRGGLGGGWGDVGEWGGAEQRAGFEGFNHRCLSAGRVRLVRRSGHHRQRGS